MNEYIPHAKRKSMLAAPVAIEEPAKTMGGSKYKASRSSSPEDSVSYALGTTESDELDSESEDSLGNSYRESFSSVATNDSSCACSTSTRRCAWGFSVVRPMSLLPVVLTASIAMYPSLSESLATASKLTHLLKKSQTLALSQAGSEAKPTPTHELIKTPNSSVWRTFLSFIIKYSMRSDDQENIDKQLWKENLQDLSHKQGEPEPMVVAEFLERELETFAENEIGHCDFLYYRSKSRSRDYRVNNAFLFRYAIDCNARISGLLPRCAKDIKASMSRPSLRMFNEKYGLKKVSEMSRDKLWTSVILPPRSDSFPRKVINSENYIQLRGEANEASIVSKNTKKLPWAARHDSMQPAGRLRGSACVKNGPSPIMGYSTPQYTVRGWENERWTPLTVSS